MKLTKDQEVCEAVLRNWNDYSTDSYLRMRATQKNESAKDIIVNKTNQGTTRSRIAEETGLGINKIQSAITLFRKDKDRFERVRLGLEPLPSNKKDEGGPWVYFIGHKDRPDLPVKIGKSNSAHGRRADLQTSHYLDLEILFVIPGYSKLEKELHKRFWDYHVNLEWFDLTQDQLEQIRKEYGGISPCKI